MAETWVLHDPPFGADTFLHIEVPFLIGAERFEYLAVIGSGYDVYEDRGFIGIYDAADDTYPTVRDDMTSILYDNGWNSWLFKSPNTITFLDPVTDEDLLAWLTEYADKRVPAVNKVDINGETVIDLTADTVTPETLDAGVTAHNSAGEVITGTRIDKTEITKTVALDLADGDQIVVPGDNPNLWTTDQSYPLSNGILYDSDTQIYTVPKTATALIAKIYTLPIPIPAGTSVTLTVDYVSGKSAKGAVVVGAYHEGSDGNSWEPDSGGVAINTDLAGTKKVVTKITSKAVTHFIIFVDSGTVGQIEEDIKFRVQYVINTVADYTMSKVTIQKPGALIPANVKKGVNIGGVIGELESGGGGATVTIENGPDTSYALQWSGDLYFWGQTERLAVTVAKNRSQTFENVCAIRSYPIYPIEVENAVRVVDVGNVYTGEIIPIAAAAYVRFNPTCLTGDTLITLSDGSLRRIDRLRIGDKVLAYDPETLHLVEDEITYTDADEHKQYTVYDLWTFDGGRTVKTVHRHRFYNVERKAMVYMDEWRIGEHAVAIDGTPATLLSRRTIHENVNHYTLFTHRQNYFANGILSGNRHTLPMKLEGLR